MMKNKIELLAVLSMLLLLTGCRNEVVLYTESENTSTSETVTSKETVSSAETESSLESEKTIMVHICGAVIRPGVYEIPYDSRIYDAVKVVGGFQEEACGDYVNLAQSLEDGCKIVIPTELQVSQETIQDKTEEPFQVVITEQNTQGENDSSEKSLLVNINTADEERLTTLTGIGKSRAKSIIVYREEHGAFNSIEEIMNVSGIKEASYQKIKDEITVK